MADLNSACLAAANALQALSHLQPGFASNVTPRLTNNERQQSTNVQSPQQSGASGQVPQNVSSIQSRLQSCFPTIASRQRRSNAVRNGRVTKSKAGRPGVPGRPKKMIVHKDLVVIPGPDFEKVPTHNSRVKLEERQLVCHEFPFNKEWNEAALKNEIFKQFPQLISLEFVKPCYGNLIKPKLAEGVQFDTERVIKMAGQGAVYVRSLFPIGEEDEDDEELYNCSLQVSKAEGTNNQANVATHTFTSPSSQEEQNVNPCYNVDGIIDVLSAVEESGSSSDTQEIAVECSRNEMDGSNVTVIHSGNNLESGSPDNDAVEGESANNQTIECNDYPIEIVQVVEQQRCCKVLHIHRLNVKKDMINAFKDPSVMDCDLTFMFIDGRGNEEKGSGIGVIRDALSLFWKEVYDSLLIGENERVPFIRHDYNRIDWEAIARVLLKGYRMCQYLPLLVSKTFLSYVLFGESSISDPNMLVQSFMQYVSADERRIIEKCLSGDLDFENENEFEELLDVLKIYDCRSRVTQENIRKIIQEIAHKEIIQKPQYVTDCWKNIVQPLTQTFPTPNSLTDMYEQVKPSVSKITKCIQSFPQSDAERECLGFLRRYIRGLDNPEKLATFVRFVSGSELMLFEGIQVTFTDLAGLERRPIALTCNTLLQLPSSYQSFPELREEFNHILMANNWEMDII